MDNNGKKSENGGEGSTTPNATKKTMKSKLTGMFSRGGKDEAKHSDASLDVPTKRSDSEDKAGPPPPSVSNSTQPKLSGGGHSEGEESHHQGGKFTNLFHRDKKGSISAGSSHPAHGMKSPPAHHSPHHVPPPHSADFRASELNLSNEELIRLMSLVRDQKRDVNEVLAEVLAHRQEISVEQMKKHLSNTNVILEGNVVPLETSLNDSGPLDESSSNLADASFQEQEEDGQEGQEQAEKEITSTSETQPSETMELKPEPSEELSPRQGQEELPPQSENSVPPLKDGHPQSTSDALSRTEEAPLGPELLPQNDEKDKNEPLSENSKPEKNFESSTETVPEVRGERQTSFSSVQAAFKASELKLSNDELIAVMKQVKENKREIDDVLNEVLQKHGQSVSSQSASLEITQPSNNNEKTGDEISTPLSPLPAARLPSFRATDLRLTNAQIIDLMGQVKDSRMDVEEALLEARRKRLASRSQNAEPVAPPRTARPLSMVSSDPLPSTTTILGVSMAVIPPPDVPLDINPNSSKLGVMPTPEADQQKDFLQVSSEPNPPPEVDADAAKETSNRPTPVLDVESKLKPLKIIDGLMPTEESSTDGVPSPEKDNKSVADLDPESPRASKPVPRPRSMTENARPLSTSSQPEVSPTSPRPAPRTSPKISPRVPREEGDEIRRRVQSVIVKPTFHMKESFELEASSSTDDGAGASLRHLSLSRPKQHNKKPPSRQGLRNQRESKLAETDASNSNLFVSSVTDVPPSSSVDSDAPKPMPRRKASLKVRNNTVDVSESNNQPCSSSSTPPQQLDDSKLKISYPPAMADVKKPENEDATQNVVSNESENLDSNNGVPESDTPGSGDAPPKPLPRRHSIKQKLSEVVSTVETSYLAVPAPLPENSSPSSLDEPQSDLSSRVSGLSFTEQVAPKPPAESLLPVVHKFLYEGLLIQPAKMEDGDSIAIPQGATVNVLESSDGSNTSKLLVEYQGKIGFVRRDALGESVLSESSPPPKLKANSKSTENLSEEHHKGGFFGKLLSKVSTKERTPATSPSLSRKEHKDHKEHDKEPKDKEHKDKEHKEKEKKTSKESVIPRKESVPEDLDPQQDPKPSKPHPLNVEPPDKHKVFSAPSFKANELKLSQDQQLQVMNLVKSGRITVEEAIAKVLNVDAQLKEKEAESSKEKEVDQEGYIVVTEDQRKMSDWPKASAFEQAFELGPKEFTDSDSESDDEKKVSKGKGKKTKGKKLDQNAAYSQVPGSPPKDETGAPKSPEKPDEESDDEEEARAKRKAKKLQKAFMNIKIKTLEEMGPQEEITPSSNFSNPGDDPFAIVSAPVPNSSNFFSPTTFSTSFGPSVTTNEDAEFGSNTTKPAPDSETVRYADDLESDPFGDKKTPPSQDPFASSTSDPFMTSNASTDPFATSTEADPFTSSRRTEDPFGPPTTTPAFKSEIVLGADGSDAPTTTLLEKSPNKADVLGKQVDPFGSDPSSDPFTSPQQPNGVVDPFGSPADDPFFAPPPPTQDNPAPTTIEPSSKPEPEVPTDMLHGTLHGETVKSTFDSE